MEFITYEVEGQVGIITINRPKALNALNSAVLDELDATINGVDLDAVRCLILTGAGEKSFVAGADIAEMSTLTKEEGEAFGKKGNDIFRKIETLPIPVIAAVNGFALGGGGEISMSCDIRICSDNAVFGAAGGWSWNHTWIWRNPETCKTCRTWHGKTDDLHCKKYQSG